LKTRDANSKANRKHYLVFPETLRHVGIAIHPVNIPGWRVYLIDGYASFWKKCENSSLEVLLQGEHVVTNRVGQQLGNYRLTRLLGQGGFADVYLGEHIHLNTQAALKVMQMRLVGTNLEEFRNEARTIATLNHPNIISILDFGQEEGIPFLVMEYASNGSLRQLYPRHARLLPEQIIPYLKQAASALHYAHTRKFIHRDVKPENMLLGREGNILLSDFGLVLVAQSTGSQLTREAAGTLPYMAPEQLQGRPRPASDQYSLGIVVYEWLCGERPFVGGPAELMGQHALTPPPPLLRKVPSLPPAIEAVVFKALAKDPQQRFANVEEFAAAFEAAWQQGTVQSATATYVHPVADSRPPYSNPPAAQTVQSTELITPVLGPMSPPTPSSPSLSSTPSAASYPSTNVRTPSPSGDRQISSPGTSIPHSDAGIQPTAFTDAATLPQSGASGPQQPVSGKPNATLSTKIVSAAHSSGPATYSPTEQVVIRTPEKELRSGKRGRVLFLFLLVVLLGGSLAGLNFARPGGIASLFTSPGSANNSGSGGGTSAGATSATVTITPDKRDLKQSYVLSAVTGTPDAAQQQVQARMLDSTSQPQAKTVPATGQGTRSATSATGTLTIMSLDGSTQTFNSGQVFTNEQGRLNIQIMIDASVTVSSADPNNSADVQAHVVQAGTVGNIAAGVFCSPVCGASPGGSWRAMNNVPFSGGQDAQTYTAVAQSDIDGAISSLVSSLTPGEQSAVQGQVGANERSVGNPLCSHRANANHAAGDQATSVTVSVTVTCTLESYDYDAARALAAQQLSNAATKNPGSGYALVGHEVTTLTQVVVADANSGTLHLTINCEGIWVYSFTPDQQQALKAYMAGKSKAVVMSWLTSQKGVSQTSIQIPDGDGNTFPSDPGKITITVQPMQGLP
jgi:serine/threonine protein kinase